MRTFIIRPAMLEDVEAIFHVHQSSVKNLCIQQYSAEQIAFWLDGRSPEMYVPAISKGSLWVAERNHILGFLEIDGSEISKLFVSSDNAFSGVGRKLLNVALDYIVSNGSEKAYLESTVTAVPFYEKHGFRVVGHGVFSHGNSPISLEIAKMVCLFPRHDSCS